MAREAKVVTSDLKAEKEYIKINSDNTLKIPFHKYSNFTGLKKDINIFVLKKKRAYANHKVLICGYINYFIENYDHDNELITSYLQLKFMVDENIMFKDDPEYFIEYLYDFLLTDTMVEKIQQMTNDLYYIDLEEQNKKSNNNYSDTIQFNNNHGKIIMAISVAMKIMIPIATHYIYKSGISGTGASDRFLIRCYEDLHSYFEGEYEINNKFYELISSRIMMTTKDDATIWKQGEIRGLDYEGQTMDSLDKLYVDIIPKLAFSGNVIHYTINSMDNNIRNKLNEKYDVDYSPVTAKQVDGLSGFEKMEMHTSRFDESVLIQNKINLKQTIAKLQKKLMVDFDEDEIDYYMENLDIKPFQRDLVFQYFAKYFGSPRELYSCNKRSYCKLIILMKRDLFNKRFMFLQHILTSRLTHFMDISRAAKKKQMTKVLNSERYKNLMEYKYSAVKGMFNVGKNMIENYVGMITSGKFELVDYEYKENTGKTLNTKKNVDLICEELLRFIEEI